MSEKVEKSFFGLQIITIKSYLWYKSGYIFDHLSNKCIYHILNCQDLVLISMFGLQLNITFWYAIQVRPKSEDIAGHDNTRMWSFSKKKKKSSKCVPNWQRVLSYWKRWLKRCLRRNRRTIGAKISSLYMHFGYHQ